ncbi:arabinofuranosidase catalytic domain-containing protein [Paraburkholderia adhaesiva]|uniref:arabinofuranosidase catalytic domain-containing protein n=1 Tax=Paraburkholderia adhaesiva TaxID=2883244 RepID=UPI001F36C412|nr:arabinofuranosidase catalytic domain-containing protein [Paraburkholderia adhaesiva]
MSYLSHRLLWCSESYKGMLDGLGAWPFVAYSLRRLTGRYLGAAIQVVRSSDAAAKDIPFTQKGDLDTATLLNFAGSGDAAVSLWYDQSGNGYHASAAAGAQPYVVQSGALVTVNMQPAVIANSNTAGQTLTSSFPAIAPALHPFTINAVFNCSISQPSGVVEPFLSAPATPSTAGTIMVGVETAYTASSRIIFGEAYNSSITVSSAAPASSTNFNSVNAFLVGQPLTLWLNGVEATNNRAPSYASINGLSLGVPALSPSGTFGTIMTSSLAEVIMLPPGYEAVLYQNQQTYWNTP